MCGPFSIFTATVVLAAHTHYVGAIAGKKMSETDRLTENLLQNYNKDAVPSLGDPTNVDITLDIKHVTWSEVESVMTLNAWLKMEWRDSRLRWEDSNISTVFLHRADIWHPDIVLKNSFSGKGDDLYGGSMILVTRNGYLEWGSSVVLETYCNFDLRNWPFEQHECDLVLGSWTLGKDQLHIRHVSCNFEEFSGQSGEFVVDSVPVRRVPMAQIGSDVSEEVVYTVVVHRQPGTYRAVIFVPAFVVIILCLTTFLLPPKSGEKVVLGGVNAMLICIFLIYFAHSLPVVTNQTPLVVVFYSTSLYLVCFSLVIAVLVLNLSRQPHTNGVPWSIKKTLTGSCGRFLLLSSYIEQVMDAGAGAGGCQEERPVVLEDQMGAQEMQPEHSRERNPQGDWVLLAAAIDRVLFIVYSLLFLAFAIAFHV